MISDEAILAQNKPPYAIVDGVMNRGGVSGSDSEFESGLPDFADPPLVEVAVAIMFDPLALDSLSLVRLHDVWESDYPGVEEHPAIPNSPVSPGLVLEVGVPQRRIWFTGDNGRLVQVQRDRLVVNWRKEADDSAYPRYGALRRELAQRLGEFQALVSARGLGLGVEPNAVEVTYVNQIPLDNDVQGLSDITTLLQPPPQDLGAPVEANYSARFDVRHFTRRKVSNLVVNAQRSIHIEPPIATLQLSCVSSASGAEDAFSALDDARYQIVQNFQSITRPEMHQKWGVKPK